MAISSRPPVSFTKPNAFKIRFMLRPQWNALLPDDDQLPRPCAQPPDHLATEIEKLHQDPNPTFPIWPPLIGCILHLRDRARVEIPCGARNSRQRYQLALLLVEPGRLGLNLCTVALRAGRRRRQFQRACPAPISLPGEKSLTVRAAADQITGDA